MNRSAGMLAALGMMLGGGAVALPAQSAWGITPMARAIGTVDHSDPVPGGGSLTEARVVEPVLMVMGHGPGGVFRFNATLDLEGLTIPGGELTPGDWGEGFVDRRHPHTYVHELLVGLVDPLGRHDGRGRLGIVLGKGFVPFGTDDPMSRPFLRFPVNHHLSQIPERAVGIVQYQLGVVTVEGSLFDGDEPTGPSDWPLIRTDTHGWRFGDSRALRITVSPRSGLEVQGSLAHIHSPESRAGAAPDAEKQSASIRWEQGTGSTDRYALIEWARTSEAQGYFVFHTFLGEGMLRGRRWSVAYRFESTERPEELRLVDLFRTQRPSPDNSILGITRWSLHTVHVALTFAASRRRLSIEPFVEGTLGTVAKVGGGIFDPELLYGTDQVRALDVGVELDWAAQRQRMGRYGVLQAMPAMSGMRM